MNLIKWLMIFSLLLLGLAGAWLFGGEWLKNHRAQSNTSREKVESLKALYAKSESLEEEIRKLKQNGEMSEMQEKDLDSIHESIEDVRSQIQENRAKTAATVLSPTHLKTRLLKPKILLAVIGLLLLLLAVIFFKNKAFGQSPRSKPIPGFTTTMRIPQRPPRTQAPPPPVYVEENEIPAPRSAPAAPPPVTREKRALSPDLEVISGGSINEQILELHRQGLSVKDISARLKIGQDQAALVVRLQAKN